MISKGNIHLAFRLNSPSRINFRLKHTSRIDPLSTSVMTNVGNFGTKSLLEKFTKQGNKAQIRKSVKKKRINKNLKNARR